MFFKKTQSQFLFVLGLLFLSLNCSTTKRAENIMPPKAEKISKELTIHGDTRVDNYFWLRERKNPKVLDYLNAENNYTTAIMKHTEKFQQSLFDEIVGRIKQQDNTYPYSDNGYYYYKKYEEGKEFPIYARKKGDLNAQEEIILNVNEMAKGYDYYHVRAPYVDENNRYMAFGVDTVSRRKYTIYFKDFKTGTILEENIPNTSGHVTWANDSKTVFYVTKDSTLRPYKIMKHIIGTDPATDVEIYHETDNTYGTYIFKSKSKKYLCIGSYSTLSTEYRVAEADHPDSEFEIFHPREEKHEYSIDHYQDRFYIVTNDNAKNFRLMQTKLNQTAKKYWKEVIPHRKDVLLEGIELFRNYLVVIERENGLLQFRIIDQRTKIEHYLDFGEEVYDAYPTDNYEFDSEMLRYNYSSLTTPNSVLDYQMSTKEKKLLKQQEVLGGFNANDYKAERHYATAKDGAKIPISLVYKKGIVKDGNNPLLLYGYGSYGYSIDPGFKSDRLSLLNRGFIFAIAHIRGGSEMGREWYDNGKLLKKKNTFTDFIDCAEYLVEQKFTNPGKLCAAGGSAGGLLIGAVINMRPDLFKGIVAAVPWVDVVTTMLDESIPLTTSEYDEWGNPNDKIYYEYMLSYSPYDNVEAKNYPAMLVTTGLHDSQVQYWEPAKWVAKLRELKTGDNVLLLHTQMHAGHSGKSGRFEKYRETALEYAFLMDQVGISRK